MQNIFGMEEKSCNNCQTFHKKEFNRLCQTCTNQFINYCPKINKFESFINPYAIICIVLLFVHLLGLIIVVQGQTIPILVSFGIWVIVYLCLVFNDLAWKFSMYRVKQRYKLSQITGRKI